MTTNNDRRFRAPMINQDNRPVYGIIDGEPVFNPDFKWPKHLRQESDVWVNDSDEYETFETES